MSNNNQRLIVWPGNKLQWLVSALLFGSFGLTFFPIWRKLFFTWWSNDDYSHGFLILPISLFLLWQKRVHYQAAPIQNSLPGLILAFLSLCIYTLSSIGGIETLAALSMVFFIMASIYYLFGLAIFSLTMFPLFLLFFMVPVPAQVLAKLTIPLQLLVSKCSAYIAQLMGIPIFRDGNVIHLPDHAFEVVQACSGLRGIMSLLTIVAVYSYIAHRFNRSRAVLFFSCVPIAVISNTLRVLIMVVVFFYFDLDLTKGFIHTIFGMSIFIVAISMLIGISFFLRRWETI